MPANSDGRVTPRRQRTLSLGARTTCAFTGTTLVLLVAVLCAAPRVLGLPAEQTSHLRPQGSTSNVEAIYQSNYTTEQSTFTVSLKVASTANISFVYFTFCQLSSPLCYLPVSMKLQGTNWYVGTTNPMTTYNGMTVGVRAGYNITIDYNGSANVTEPAEPNRFTNLSIAQSVTGEYMFQMTVMNQLYQLSGVVTDQATGQAVGGAVVSISPGNDSPVTTSSTGAYTFPGLANGTYTVSVAAHGFPNAQLSVPINGGSVVKDFALGNTTVPSNPGQGGSHPSANFFTSTTGIAVVAGAILVLVVLVAVLLPRRRRRASAPAETVRTPDSSPSSGSKSK